MSNVLKTEKTRDAAVCHCEHAEQTRGIWRGLYVERRTIGTHPVYGRTQESASLKKYFLLMLYWHSYIFLGASTWLIKEINSQWSRRAGRYHLLSLGSKYQLGCGLPRLGFYFLTCTAHDMSVCIFLRAIMYRPTYGPPIRGFIWTSATQFIYFFWRKCRGMFYFSL